MSFISKIFSKKPVSIELPSSGPITPEHASLVAFTQALNTLLMSDNYLARSDYKHLVESDFVEAIIQLPNNIFYNTGISTYVWLLTNKKVWERKDKIQLIDASGAFEKLRKSQGFIKSLFDLL